MILEYLKVGFKSEVRYRFYFLFKILFNMVPVLVTCFIWIAVYNNNTSGTIAGITKNRMIGYILLTNMVFSLIEIDRLVISQDIQSGNICNYLVKPMNYLIYRFSMYISSILVEGVGFLIPSVVILFYFKVTGFQIFAFTILLIEAILTNILFTFLLSSITYWLFHISSLFYLLNFVLSFFAGTLIPINVFPAYLRHISNYLPFKNMGYEVSACIFIDVSSKKIYSSILNGCVWIIILFVLTEILWRRGKRRYEAFGG